jgi:GT2 family glycosyltransferase
MLVRTEVFKRFGILDEELLSLREHHDLCLTIQEAGGSIYFEPNAVVSYVAPKSITWSDLPYFMLRWSETWNLASIQHFYEKWNLDMDNYSINEILSRARRHRIRFLTQLRKLIHLIFRHRGARWVEQIFLFPIEKALNRCLAPYISKKYWKGLDQAPNLHSNFS